MVHTSDVTEKYIGLDGKPISMFCGTVCIVGCGVIMLSFVVGVAGSRPCRGARDAIRGS